MANNKTEIALALIRIKQQDRRIPIGFGDECGLARKSSPDKPKPCPQQPYRAIPQTMSPDVRAVHQL